MDWKKLISELMDCGMTQKAIGEYIGLSQGAISQILKGLQDDVRWNDGEKLRELHAAKLAERDVVAKEQSIA